jgi:hypothetical protein
MNIWRINKKLIKETFSSVCIDERAERICEDRFLESPEEGIRPTLLRTGDSQRISFGRQNTRGRGGEKLTHTRERKPESSLNLASLNLAQEFNTIKLYEDGGSNNKRLTNRRYLFLDTLLGGRN